MLIVGAKGHAKEILAVLEDNNFGKEIAFFDNITQNLSEKIFDKYYILTSLSEAQAFIGQERKFILGIGNPAVRKKLFEIFISFAEPFTLISKTAIIGKHEVSLGKGLNIMFNTFISNSTTIHDGALLNSGVYIHHDVEVGYFSELAPGVKVLGGAKVGDFSFVGANAVVLPGVKVGSNVVIGAGALVTKDIPDNSLALGVPAKVINDKLNI